MLGIADLDGVVFWVCILHQACCSLPVIQLQLDSPVVGASSYTPCQYRLFANSSLLPVNGTATGWGKLKVPTVALQLLMVLYRSAGTRQLSFPRSNIPSSSLVLLLPSARPRHRCSGCQLGASGCYLALI